MVLLPIMEIATTTRMKGKGVTPLLMQMFVPLLCKIILTERGRGAALRQGFGADEGGLDGVRRSGFAGEEGRDLPAWDDGLLLDHRDPLAAKVGEVLPPEFICFRAVFELGETVDARGETVDATLPPFAVAVV